MNAKLEQVSIIINKLGECDNVNGIFGCYDRQAIELNAPEICDKIIVDHFRNRCHDKVNKALNE